MKIKISYQVEETAQAAAAAPFFHLYMKTCKPGGNVVQYPVEKPHGVPPQG